MDNLLDLGSSGLVVIMALVIVEMSKVLISKMAEKRNGKRGNPGHGNPISDNPGHGGKGLKSEERDILIRLDDMRKAYWNDHRAIISALDRLSNGQQATNDTLQRIEGRITKFSMPPKPAG